MASVTNARTDSASTPSSTAPSRAMSQLPATVFSGHSQRVPTAGR